MRKKAKEIGAVFIFDEITSGFRETVGGYHLKYKINPDVAILSKAMSNGYPSSAIIGKKCYGSSPRYFCELLYVY